MKFTFRGGMIGGKNMIQTAYIGGKKIRYPTAHFKAWRNDFLRQLYQQREGLQVLFTEPVWFEVDYYPHDRKSRDMPGMMDALFHLMEHGNVVADDKLFKVCRGWTEHDPAPGCGVLEISIGKI